MRIGMDGRTSVEKEQEAPRESPCGKRPRESKTKSELECESASGQKVTQTENKRGSEKRGKINGQSGKVRVRGA
jgi:hypothetical protein